VLVNLVSQLTCSDAPFQVFTRHDYPAFSFTWRTEVNLMLPFITQAEMYILNFCLIQLGLFNFSITRCVYVFGSLPIHGHPCPITSIGVKPELTDVLKLSTLPHLPLSLGTQVLLPTPSLGLICWRTLHLAQHST
jgi:hypothetical protein